MPPFSHQALICANAKVKQNAQDFLQETAFGLGHMESYFTPCHHLT
jgi:primosomal protein N'